MDEPLGGVSRFLRELKRRKVYRVAVAYAAVAFVGFEAAQMLIPTTRLPGWADEFILFILIIGFPVALVLAWAFEMTPEGVRRTRSLEEDAAGGAEVAPDRFAAGPSRSRFAVKALVGLGLAAGAVAAGWYLMGGGGESPEITEQAVAVLPFQVSGSGTETWREGMVTVLTTGLDGAAGLRAIADRSVLSAWERAEQAPAGRPGGDRALSVARQVGAEYAVVGSAVRLGSEVRFSATVHQTSPTEQLGQAEVRGPPDSVTMLADELTRRLLGVLLEESGEALPSVDLGALTTRSLPALKSFLRGEEHFRRGELEAAISEYRRAVERDSLFALAHWRLGRSYGWRPAGADRERVRRHRVRAYELSDRLPERERRLVRADYLLRGRRPAAAADSLQTIVRVYPDDADAWYLLGEASIHYAVPPGWPEADRAFGRAVALDPGFAPYHIHRVHLAFSVHRDSAVAADRIAAHPALEGSERWVRFVHDMVFGDSARRARALAGLDTVSDRVLNELAPYPLLHPVDGELLESVLEEIAGRSEIPNPPSLTRANLVLVSFHSIGQVRRGLGHLAHRQLDPTQRACLPAFARSVGIPVPDSLRPEALAPARLDEQPPPEKAACIGLYAAARGQEAVLERALAYLRTRVGGDRDTAARPGAPGARYTAERLRALLIGYRAWKAGRPEEAARTLSRAPVGDQRRPTGIWMGDIYRELGDLERAERWYLGSWYWPLAHERLGRLYEEMGRPGDAAAAYRRFIEGWEEADEELQGRVQRARERIRGLTAGGEVRDGAAGGERR